MKEFFHGWRRKAGVVSLGFALAFMGGWIRSLSIGDQFRLPSDNRTHSYIASERDGLVWFVFQETGSIHLSRSEVWYQPIKMMTRFREEFFIKGSPFIDADIVDWQVDCAGCWLAQGHSEGFRKGIVIVPYPLVVIPLTLLSAYLILWKPRKRGIPELAGRDL